MKNPNEIQTNADSSNTSDGSAGITPAPKFDPAKEMQRLVDADTEAEDAKAFVNSRIRFLKALGGSKLLKAAFKSRGVDVDHWGTLEELA